MKTERLKKYFRKFLKITAWVVLSVVFLLVLIVLAIQIPAIQNKITQEAVSFLQTKIGTEVRLEHIRLKFPKKIELTGLFLEDQRRDTLLYAGRLTVEADLFVLVKNKIDLQTIELESFTSKITRSEADSSFNFDYIIEAFATDTPTVEDTTSVWTIALGKIDLKGINISLKDSLAGNDIAMRLGALLVNTKVFDITHAVIKVEDIILSDLFLNVTQNKLPVVTTDSLETATVEADSILFDFDFGEIKFNTIEARYLHERTGENAHIKLGDFAVTANRIDLQHQLIELEKITLSNSTFSYAHQASDDAPEKENDKEKNPNGSNAPEAKAIPWAISLAALELSNNAVHYNNVRVPEASRGFDPHHLSLTNLDVDVTGIAVNGKTMKATLNRLSFHEKNGFDLESFGAFMELNDESLTVRDFNFNSAKSKIQLQAYMQFNSLDELAEKYPEAKLQLQLLPSSVAMEDLLYFNPSLADSLPLKLHQVATVQVAANANGAVNDLHIERFLVSVLQQSALDASGRIRGLPDMQRAVMSIDLNKLYTTRHELQTLLADTLIPESIQLPAWMNLAAQLRGTLSNPSVKAKFTSDFGAVDLRASVNLDSGVKENYSGELQIHAFHVGNLLKQPETIGVLDMGASVRGAGLNADELDALVEMNLNVLEFSGYTYRDFKLDGALKKQFFTGNAFMDDPNLAFEFQGGFDYNGEHPQYEFTFDLKNADFKALQLAQRPIRAKATLDVNLSTPDFKVLNGYVDIRKVAVYDGDHLYAVDSLLFASIDLEGQNEVSVRSDILSGDFKGTINVFALPDVLGRHFNKFFSLNDTLYNKPLESQNFEFDLVLKNTDLITEILIPEIDFVPVEIRGAFNSDEDHLDLRINMAEINYDGLLVDSVLVKLQSDAKSIDFTLNFEKIQKDTLRIHELRLAANVMNDSIRTSFRILDSLEQEKYFLGGALYSFEDAFQFSFLPGQIRLNYEDWETRRYNSLRFSPEGLQPNNFFISRGDSRILLVKRDDLDSTLSLMFNVVDLKSLSSVVEGTTPVGGLIDGELNIGVAKTGSFSTDLSIKDFSVLEKTWGDLWLTLGQPVNGPLNIRLELEGENAEAVVYGYVTRDSIPQIGFDASVPRIDLSIVEPLTMGQLKNLTGELNATASLKGTTEDLAINGKINLRNTNFIASYVNSEFTLEDEVISITWPRIEFNNFKILDNKKNAARIIGYVSADTTEGFLLRLNAAATNFQLLNTTATDNDLFYGNVRINANASINGSTLEPHIQMRVGLSKDSEFTYVVPQSEQGVTEQKGIVVFVDKDAQGDPFMESIDPRDTVKATVSGMDLTANIELTGDETFHVIIDPVTGDRLSVKGHSTLTFTMDPSGDMQLTGRYEITEGTYDLSFYKLVKRNFKIEPGSYIMWSGNPLNAQMRIRAIYEVETSPIDLMANQVGEEELNMYKQRVPFLVYLQIEGELLVPEISFELDMPANQQNVFGGSVYAKIRDVNTRESDLNKQVFALLVLKRFVSDNPLESQAGGDVASSARRSASKLLTEQLNRLSQNVRGVELSFDLRSYDDYSAGDAEGRTELQLGVSKTFLNDRLVVKLSGNVDLEGDQSEQSSFSDFIGDLALEYKLTEDGRFRITGFRNSNYDMIDGELIETGAGLIYIKDYDSLRELFRSNIKSTNK